MGQRPSQTARMVFIDPRLSPSAAMATALSGSVALAPFSRSETGVEACTTSTLFRSLRFEIA